MPRLVLALVVAFSVGVSFAPPPLAAQTNDPVAIVEAIYAQYGPDSWPEQPQDLYFTPSLLALYNEVAEGSGDKPELGIDFDAFLNAQDVDEVTNLTTRIVEQTTDRELVDVTFTAFEQETIMRYTFAVTPDGWKIDDIAWGEEGAALRPLLDQLRQDQANAG